MSSRTLPDNRIFPKHRDLRGRGGRDLASKGEHFACAIYDGATVNRYHVGSTGASGSTLILDADELLDLYDHIGSIVARQFYSEN